MVENKKNRAESKVSVNQDSGYILSYTQQLLNLLVNGFNEEIVEKGYHLVEMRADPFTTSTKGETLVDMIVQGYINNLKNTGYDVIARKLMEKGIYISQKQGARLLQVCCGNESNLQFERALFFLEICNTTRADATIIFHPKSAQKKTQGSISLPFYQLVFEQARSDKYAREILKKLVNNNYLKIGIPSEICQRMKAYLKIAAVADQDKSIYYSSSAAFFGMPLAELSEREEVTLRKEFMKEEFGGSEPIELPSIRLK